MHLHRRAPRLFVDQQTAALGADRKGVGERQRAVAVLAQHAVAAGLGAGRGIGADRPPLGDMKAFGDQGLDADVIGAGGDRRFDAGFEQLLESGEERVLQIDAQRQHAVEELRDRRQFLAQRAVLVDEIEPGAVLEVGQRAALDLPGVKQLVELAQRRLGVGAFEIVVGAEQPLAAGLALAAGNGAEGVETPRDRRQEALLALDVGRDRTEHRRLFLIGAVGAAETLDCGIGPPAGFEQIMDALALIAAGEIGVIAAAGAAGIGENEDALN